MFLQRISETMMGRVAGALIILALTQAGMCQTTQSHEAESDSADALEEIVVYGNNSLGRLRYEMYRAEDKVFDLFNSHNSDNEFDIHCYKESRTGTRIKQRVCKPNYVDDLIAEATFLTAAGMPYSHPTALIRRKDKLLLAEMEAMLVDKPGLVKALNEFTVAKQTLESEHERRCEGHIFICQR